MVATGQAVGLSALSGPAGLLVAQAVNGAARSRYVLWSSAAAVIVLLLVMALVVAWLERWRKRPEQDKMSASDQLARFRELYERGELSPEEFARIRTLLGDRLKEELDLPTAAPESDSPPEPPPPAPPKP
jgi:uncharacterized membrane protein